MKRALLTGAVSGGAALIASGVASFWLTSAVFAVPDAPRQCPGAPSFTCLGTLTVDDVVRPLSARGFECGFSGLCTLLAGGGAYRVQVQEVGGAVDGYRLEARFDRTLGPSQRALDLLSWFAKLPFGHDPATASAARAWTLQQVRAHAHGSATINGYGYEVEASGNQATALLLECASALDCPVLFHGYLMLSVQGAP
jgi:hypothetical protein